MWESLLKWVNRMFSQGFGGKLLASFFVALFGIVESRWRLLNQLRTMSLGVKLFLAFFAALFGIVMFLIGLTGPPSADKAPLFYAFSLFCLLIAAATLSKGRVAEFFGSAIALMVLLVTLFYLGNEISEGTFWSGARSKPSVVNALIIVILFDVPATMYIIKAKFGFGKRRDDRQDMPDSDG